MLTKLVGGSIPDLIPGARECFRRPGGASLVTPEEPQAAPLQFEDEDNDEHEDEIQN